MERRAGFSVLELGKTGASSGSDSAEGPSANEGILLLSEGKPLREDME